ncbi:MAG: LytR C-terminal domain-containing protein [Micrococcales bacterium]|nr:LytR C-terminal domain-containing protein [Micrococcales bacterium]
MNTTRLARIQRNRLIIRQIAIFGALLIALAVAGFGSWAMFQGKMEPLFSAPFTSATPETQDLGPLPCPVGNNPAFPLPDTVRVNALNGSSIRQAAGAAKQTLESRDFHVVNVENAPIQFSGPALVRTGAEGVNAAYLVLAHAPEDAVLAFDNRADATVDLIVGSQWTGLRPMEEVAAAPGTPIAPPEECTPLPEILATMPPLPTP